MFDIALKILFFNKIKREKSYKEQIGRKCNDYLS